MFLGTLYAVGHAVMAVVLLSMSSSDGLSRRCVTTPTTFLTAVHLSLAVHILGALTFATLAAASFRGRLLEPSKRWLVPVALYLCAIVGVVEIVSSIWTTTFFQRSNAPSSAAFLSQCDNLMFRSLLADIVVSYLQWVYFILFFVLNFTFTGNHLVGRDVSGESGSGGFRNHHEHFEDLVKLWEQRMRTTCCCFTKAENDAVFSDIAITFAALFGGHDIVTSDIAVGLILLYAHQQRAYERRLRLVSREYRTVLDRSLPPSVSASPTFRAPHAWTEADRRNLQLILFFSDYMLGSYGHLNYIFMHPITGLPELTCADPCAGCRARPGYHRSGGCRCDNTALTVITGLADDDILMTSFDTDVLQPVYYVAVERKTRSIMVVVRGTMSIQDCMTDGAALPHEFRVSALEGQAVYGHSGFFHGAEKMLQQISSFGIVDNVILQSHADHNIVFIGHSLGAGTAILATILFRDRYPASAARVRCFAYAPPGGLLSSNLAEHTRSYVIGMFYGNDLVPRLSHHSVHELRDSMFKALAATSQAKCSLMSHVCCPTATQQLPDDVELPAEVQQQLQLLLTPPTLSHPRLLDVRLHPPVNMIHFVSVAKANGCGNFCCNQHVKKCDTPAVDRMDCFECCCCHRETYCPFWIHTDELHHIVVSPDMIFDHFPDRFWKVLQRTIPRVLAGEMDKFLLTATGDDHHRGGGGGGSSSSPLAGSDVSLPVMLAPPSPTGAAVDGVVAAAAGGGSPLSQRGVTDETVSDLIYRPRLRGVTTDAAFLNLGYGGTTAAGRIAAASA